MRRPVAEALARRQLDGVRVNGILTVGPPEAEPDAPCDAYRVYLVTGDLRGAGSACGVRVKLSGAVRESGWVQLTDVHDHPLERASIEEFDVDVRQTGGKGGGERRGDIGECAVDERAGGGEGEGDALDDGRGPVPTHGLGELLGFEVFFDKGGEEQRVDGWFLDRAEVTHRRSGERWVFPCARWFGEAAGPDSPARVFQRLVPRSGDAMGHGVAHGRDVPGHARAARPLRVRPADAPKLRLHCGAAAVPHPKKVQQGIRGAVLREEGHAGEDAYFVLRGGQHAIGVADGVYLWRDHGIDAGEFARSLMSAAKSAAAALGDPVDVLRVARQAVRDMPGVKGSCTACVLTLDCNAGVIRSANIGDSGFAVFRPSGRVAFHTPQQEYNFGCPYQLGHHEGANEADDAQVATVAVDSGDIIVAGRCEHCSVRSKAKMTSRRWSARARAQFPSPASLTHRDVRTLASVWRLG